MFCIEYCTKKWSFPLRISSVNVTESPGNCGFGHIYWRNPSWTTSFFVSDAWVSYLNAIILSLYWLLLPFCGEGMYWFYIHCMHNYIFGFFMSWTMCLLMSLCFEKIQYKQETLRIVTIAMFCSALASLGKFQYFWRPIYNPVKHLWGSFYCKNSKPLSMFQKPLHGRCSLGF